MAAVSEMGCTLLSADVFPRVSVEAAFEDMLQSTPRFALDTAKKIVKRMKKPESQTTRASREAAELDRRALEFASIIQEASLPVVFHVEGLADPTSA